MNYDSTHIDNLIARYLAGETSEKEWEELSLWMDNSPENKKYFEGIKFVHDKAVSSHRIVKVDVDKAWQKLSYQMTGSEQPASAKKIIPLYKQRWLRVAASITILIAVSSIIFFVLRPGKISESYRIATTDSVKTHVLAHSTSVTLNKNSNLTFVSKKAGKQQELELKGEAFIEVNHGADTTLIVKAGETYIRDIGTSFNVKAYSDSSTIEVFVRTGEVAFYTQDNTGITVKAGETGVYNKQQKEFYIPGEVDINTIAYKSKIFVFRDIPLSKAISALNSVYGNIFGLENQSLGNCSITVTFDNESPAGIADIIAETLGLQVLATGNRYVLTGETCTGQP